MEKVSVQQLLVYNIHQLLAAFSIAQPVETKSRVELYCIFGNCVIHRFVVMYDCMVGQIFRVMIILELKSLPLDGAQHNVKFPLLTLPAVVTNWCNSLL